MQTKSFNVYDEQNQAVRDAYAMLTANIYLSANDKPNQSIVISSSEPGAGKTYISISLAISMAKSGWRVLLIDGDLRKPSLAKRLNGEAILGLSDYLCSEIELSDVLCRTNVQKLTYIACGNKRSNPIGILCSAKFNEFMQDVKREYDFIIIDSPALGTIADASLLASRADVTLLVVEMGESSIVSIKSAKEQLENVNANLLGVILNKVKKNDYKGYFASYDYFADDSKFLRKAKKARVVPKIIYNKDSKM